VQLKQARFEKLLAREDIYESDDFVESDVT
jgi:hypothetical protein